MIRTRLLVVLMVLLLGASVCAAVTRYVDNNATRCPGCNNSNSCTTIQTITTGAATINRGIECTASGDTLLIRGGTYAEFIQDVTSPIATSKKIASGGGSWATATTIGAYNNEEVILKPARVTGQVAIIRFKGTPASSYIIFDGLTLDGASCRSTSLAPDCNGLHITVGTHHIRFQNGVVKNIYGYGALSASNEDGTGTNNHEFINNDIFDIGPTGSNGKFQHGIYIDSNNNLVERNRVHNISGYTIHLYASAAPFPTGNILRQNELYLNATFGAAAGNVLICCDNNQFYNNIVRNSQGGAGATASGVGITLNYGTPSGNLIANNTICSAVSNCMYLSSSTSSNTIVNNVCYQTTSPVIKDEGTSNTLTTNTISGNPLFVGGCSNVHLQSGSPAINTGTSQSGTFTTDFAGTSRTGTWERGAYTFETTVSPLALTFAQPPLTTAEDTTLAPVVVEVVDSADVIQTGHSNNCVIALAANPGSSTLSGTLTKAPVSGVCTFDNLSLNNVGTGYTLTVTSTGATSVTSPPFNVTTTPTVSQARVRRVR